MSWARLAAIIVGAGVVSSLTDWFFAGDWLHRRYTYPEIWRQGGESRAIVQLHKCVIGEDQRQRADQPHRKGQLDRTRYRMKTQPVT